MKPPFLKSLRLDGFLSFAPGSESIELQGLNVLIGPNGSGKSNVIEAVELLKSLPVDFAAAVRMGGGAEGFLWKGGRQAVCAAIEATMINWTGHPYLYYRIMFDSQNQETIIIDEEFHIAENADNIPFNAFFSGYRQGNLYHSVINKEKDAQLNGTIPNKIRMNGSIMDPRVVSIPSEEFFAYGDYIGDIQTFREWTFGRSSALRRAQPTDMPDDALLYDNSNLALMINKIENEGDWPRFNALLKRFFPRFERMTTRTAGNTIQFYLWETGFSSPISPSRMSDGTLRFIAILATLLTPEPPPLICIEEPELGLHPDAMAIMAEVLVEASERMQIIVTTHSDALVSALTLYPQSILICERLGGGTQIRRLEPEKLAEWLKDYTLGDLWRMGHLGANP